MWNLDDKGQYIQVLRLDLPWAHTYADMRPGFTDRERREHIREAAVAHAPQPLPQVMWWAFRITVEKTRRAAFDIENVPKPIIDSFCRRQIQRDNSAFPSVALYLDDTVDFVRMVLLFGERCSTADHTSIEIFGRKPG